MQRTQSDNELKALRGKTQNPRRHHTINNKRKYTWILKKRKSKPQKQNREIHWTFPQNKREKKSITTKPHKKWFDLGKIHIQKKKKKKKFNKNKIKIK